MVAVKTHAGLVETVQDDMTVRFLNKCATQVEHGEESSTSFGQKSKDVFEQVRWLCRDEKARSAFRETFADIADRVGSHVAKPEHVLILYQTALETVCRRNDDGGAHVWKWLKMAPVEPEQIVDICESSFKSPDRKRTAVDIVSQGLHLLPDAGELYDIAKNRWANLRAAAKTHAMFWSGKYKM